MSSPIESWHTVAEGHYGKVTYARLKEPPRNVAIKWIPFDIPEVGEDDDDLDTTSLTEAQDEFIIAAVLGAARLPSFPRVYTAFIAHVTGRTPGVMPPTSPMAEFAQGRYLALVTLFAERGTLYDLTRGGGKLKETQAAAILFDMAWSFMEAHRTTGLHYHGDLQARNIVFKARSTPATSYALHDDATTLRWKHESTRRALVIDMGFASYATSARQPHYAYRTVAYHSPPELYFGRADMRGPSSDVWQLGVLCFTLFAKQPRRLFTMRHEDTRTFVDAEVIDLIDLPAAWLTGLARARGLEPLPLADVAAAAAAFAALPVEDTDGIQAHVFRCQSELSKAFVALLATLPMPSVFKDALAGEDAAANKYGRFINVALLQEILGNGWRPSDEVATATGFAESLLHQCLHSAPVETFFKERVLDEDLLLHCIMTRMVGSLPPDVRTLLARMLCWDPRARPTCEEIVRDPVFRRLLDMPATEANATRHYVASTTTTARPLEERAREHATLRALVGCPDLACTQSDLMEKLVVQGATRTIASIH